MNDSEAAAEFLQSLNRPCRSAVSLDTQTIDAWRESEIGLNPVQAGMQVAIPEIDGATEPFIYGGDSGRGGGPLHAYKKNGGAARGVVRREGFCCGPRGGVAEVGGRVWASAR